MDFWWSWIITLVSITPLIFVGRGYWWGWLLGLGAQVVWLVYAIDTQQWGFIFNVIIYTAVYANNMVLAKKRTELTA